MTPTVKQLRQAGYKVRVMHYRHVSGEENPISTYYIRLESKHDNLQAVLPYGGITIVTIKLPIDDRFEEIVGIAECSRKEQFSYKTGLNIAIGRAIQSIKKTGIKLKL